MRVIRFVVLEKIVVKRLEMLLEFMMGFFVLVILLRVGMGGGGDVFFCRMGGFFIF